MGWVGSGGVEVRAGWGGWGVVEWGGGVEVRAGWGGWGVVEWVGGGGGCSGGVQRNAGARKGHVGFCAIRSPHLTSPHLTSPHVTSRHLT